MQKFKIKEIIPPKDDKSPTILKDDAGTTISGFDAKLKDLTVGTEIEAEIIVKGKYNNIKTWTLVSLAQSPGTASPIQDQTITRMQISASYRAVAIAAAVRLAAHGVITEDAIEKTAGRFLKWLQLPPARSGSVTSSKPAQVSTEPPAGSVEDQWEGMGRHNTRAPSSITTLGELFTACAEDFKLTPTQVLAELGVSKKEDITKPLAECYSIIAAPRRD